MTFCTPLSPSLVLTLESWTGVVLLGLWTVILLVFGFLAFEAWRIGYGRETIWRDGCMTAVVLLLGLGLWLLPQALTQAVLLVAAVGYGLYELRVWWRTGQASWTLCLLVVSGLVGVVRLVVCP